jgi:hypothetical protein
LKQILSKNCDLLGFQLLNWSGSLLLFSAFVRFENTEIFARIGKAEVMLGFIGVFLMSASLHRHADGLSKQGERPLLWFRISVALLGWLGALTGIWHVLYAFAAMSVAAIPAHIPLLLGYRPIIYVLLLSKILIAGISFYFSGFGLNITALAAIYFAPAIIYGIGCYAYYWRYLPDGFSPTFKSPEKGRDLHTYAFQLITIAACNVAQSNLVFQLIKMNGEIAIFERLLRSFYSFCFPYTVRYSIWSNKAMWGVAIGILTFFAILSASDIKSSIPALIVGPLIIDVFSSVLAGKFLIIDAAMILLLFISRLITP